MVKKLFALASVSALAGLVSAVGAAGCSETVVQQNPTDAGPTDSGKKDSKAPVTGDDEEDEEPPSCLSTDPIDATQFPYTKALKSPGACTNDELKAISAFFKAKTDANEDVSVEEWSGEVSDKCAACVFSAEDAAEWAPIIVKDDKLDNVNRGGCIEILSGKEECGQTYQQVTECRLEACLIKCKTQDEFTACLQDAQGIFTGPCKEAYDAMDQACGNNLGAYENGCKGTAWTFEGPIKVQCITGGGGGNADAGDGGN